MTLFLLAAFNIFKHPSTVGFIISVFLRRLSSGQASITTKICGNEEVSKDGVCAEWLI